MTPSFFMSRRPPQAELYDPATRIIEAYKRLTKTVEVSDDVQ